MTVVPSRTRPLLLASLGLAACGMPLPEEVEGRPSSALLEEGLAQVSPDPWVALVDDTLDFTGELAACAVSERVEQLDEDGVLISVREVWEGPCELDDGTTVQGHLERFEAEELSWLAGQGFELRRDGELLFLLDGAVELGGQGDLLLVDAAATTCGGPGEDCQLGTHTLDLTWTVYPASAWGSEDEPGAYDVTVSGVVASESAFSDDGPLAIEGTWSIDEGACGAEPASGTIAVERGERHSIELDGLAQCDACATWVFQGEELDRYCGLAL